MIAPMPDSASSHSAPRGQAPWIAPAALAVAVISVAIAVWALVKSPSSQGVELSEDDAKAQICEAYQIVRGAISLQTNADLGPDPVAVQSVAANARLAALGGGLFLLSRLNEAAPSELADAVRSFATDLEYVGMVQLSGAAADDAAQLDRTNRAQTMSNRIGELCG